jgi:hypothetical protein
LLQEPAPVVLRKESQLDIAGKMLPMHLQKLVLFVEQLKAILLMFPEKKTTMGMFIPAVIKAQNITMKPIVLANTATK